MTSGLESTSGPAYGAWVSSGDWVRSALERPLLHPPGETFEYSTGSTHLLAAALGSAVGGDLRVWAEEELFAPAGMRVADWMRDPQGRRFGGNGMAMAPADLAAFGRLLLAGGQAGDRQVVPRRWIEASWRPRAEGWPDRYGAYGYLWWLPFDDAVLAAGFGGQFLLLLPGSGALAVMTSSHAAKGAEWDREALELLRRAAACRDDGLADPP
jgi:CubicO group peptidase (beta-lactamase class C family)